MFDALLRPVVIEVNGLPSMQLSDKQGAQVNFEDAYTKTKLQLTSDVVALVFKPDTVASQAQLYYRLAKL